jgi:hypothetical protein
VTRIFLHLVFRNFDGSLTTYSWFLAAVAVFMVGSGIWCLVSPESYVRYMSRGRRAQRPSGHFWMTMASARWTRIAGALAIILAVGFMGWVLLLSQPGQLY